MSEPIPSATDAQDRSEREPSPWPDWSSGLHQSLALHEASAAELRRQLADLRRTLDAAPGRPPALPPARPGRRMSSRLRRRPLLAGATVAVVIIALAAVVAARAARTGSPAESAPTRTASAAVEASPAAGPSAPRASSATAARQPAAEPMPNWPGQTGPEPPGLPARGVGADAAGTELTAALAGDRSIDVFERAVLRPGATTFALRPAGSSDVARTLGAGPPAVQDLHAEIEGRPVPVTPTAGGWTVAAPAGATASRVTLRYRLTGALLRREPAPPGRYTLVLTPLAPSAGDGADAAVVVRITDPRIEELYCPGAANQLCGRESGALHTAAVPAGASPVVVALVTLTS